MSVWHVATFYRFTPLPDAAALCKPIEDLCVSAGLCGSILLAHEGINGTVAGPEAGLCALFEHLDGIPGLEGLTCRASTATEQPFKRMKVRLRKEIVTLGAGTVDSAGSTGEKVPPEEWNRVIDDPDILVIDTRNDYETGIGTFRDAIDPGTAGFRDFPAWVKSHLDPDRHKKVAMFCTGGIRCEKASAWMAEQGFESVLQLEGGILNYLEKVPEAESRWLGECFVFDQRVAVRHGVEEGNFDMCLGCGGPIDEHDRRSDKYEAGVRCPRCFDLLSEALIEGARERRRQLALQRAREDGSD